MSPKTEVVAARPRERSAVSGLHPLVETNPRATRCILLDFDGTLTDSEKEAEPFLERYRRGVARMIRISENGLMPLWDHVQKEILSDPFSYGWVIGGKTVAPAYPDPYIMATVTANGVLDMLDMHMDAEERFARLDALFHSSYQNGALAYREGARDFVKRLMEEFDVFIVTSSATKAVQDKVGFLGLKRDPPVLGESRKFLLDDSWDEVPETFAPDGYGRPVHLRRKAYWEAMSKAMGSGNYEKGELLVIGDIYELDLSLPHFLDMRICLAAGDRTPPHHISTVIGYGSGSVIKGLGEAAEDLKGIKNAA